MLPGADTGSSPDWDGLFYTLLVGLVTLAIEYLRRKLPPPRENHRHRRHDDPDELEREHRRHDDDEESTDEAS